MAETILFFDHVEQRNYQDEPLTVGKAFFEKRMWEREKAQEGRAQAGQRVQELEVALREIAEHSDVQDCDGDCAVRLIEIAQATLKGKEADRG